jgi:hypothetical protein
MKKWTAVYTRGWSAGSHYQTTVCARRIIQEQNEPLNDCFDRHDIDKDAVVFCFEGHPKNQREDEPTITQIDE